MEVTYKSRWRDFLRQYRMLTVISSVVILWMIISFGVYRVEYELETSNIKSFGDALWWGLVTILTIGYGDLYPVSVWGRFLSAILMIGGVLTFGIITAKISMIFLQQVLLEGKYMLDTKKLKDHFIICGWKEDMHELLIHMVEFNKDLEPDQLVVIANVSDLMVADLKSQPRLRDIHFLQGEPHLEGLLKRAHPKEAKKILILADKAPDASGRIPHDSETDARTIITAIVISRLAKKPQITAELLDKKLEEHLRMAGVTDIIYSREYSRLLLGNAAQGTGVPNIIYDLLDPRTGALVSTPDIAENEIGESYQNFKRRYENDHRGSVVIGVLENSGNPQKLKEISLREAQKTADVSHLIKNLTAVKELRYNSPIFNPSHDYPIKRGSCAIVIENQHKSQAS